MKLWPRLLSCLLAITLIFMVAPLIVVALVSVNPARISLLPEWGQPLSLKWYVRIFEDGRFVEAFINSALLAGMVCFISLAVGGLAAYGLVRFRFPGRAAVELLVLSPILVPSVILGITILQFLSALKMNGTYLGLLGGHVAVCTPYAFRVLSGSIARVNPELERAARNLGATRLQTTWKVTIPLLKSGLLAAAAFAFLISFDEFIISLFLAPIGFRVLPVQVYSYVQDVNDPLVAAVSTGMMLFAFGFVMILERSAGLKTVLGSN